MRNFVITWDNGFINYISLMTDATKEQVEKLTPELSEKIKSIPVPLDENEDPMFKDPYEIAIEEFFHEKGYVCCILTLYDVIEL